MNKYSVRSIAMLGMFTSTLLIYNPESTQFGTSLPYILFFALNAALFYSTIGMK